MIDEELMSKFDRIQDLPVSEEMLGAYLEGNLDFYEMQDLSNIANNDPMLQSIIEETTSGISDNGYDIDSTHSDSSYDEEIYEDALSGVDYESPHDNLDADDFLEDCDYGTNYHDIDTDHTIDIQSFELPDIPFF